MHQLQIHETIVKAQEFKVLTLKNFQVRQEVEEPKA